MLGLGDLLQAGDGGVNFAEGEADAGQEDGGQSRAWVVVEQALDVPAGDGGGGATAGDVLAVDVASNLLVGCH